MPLTSNINLVVPDLPDDEVWWANAAAWSNYWKDINITVTFDPTASSVYNEQPYDATLNFTRLNVDGVDYDVPSYQQHQSLVAAYSALNADYKALKQVLKDAGLIDNV